MTNKDKVIAAFLVSVGLFSAAQAMQYVATMSKSEKNTIVSVAQDPNILIANSAILGTEGEGKQSGA